MVIEIDQETEEEQSMFNSIGMITRPSDNITSIIQSAWDNISLVDEYHKYIPANDAENRRVLNSILTLKIELGEIET